MIAPHVQLIPRIVFVYSTIKISTPPMLAQEGNQGSQNAAEVFVRRYAWHGWGKLRRVVLLVNATNQIHQRVFRSHSGTFTHD